MNTDFAQKLKKLMTQLDISNAQLAKALNVDPSLISRWLKSGCGERKAAEHSLAIEKYILRRTFTPENRAWLSSEIGEPLLPETAGGQIARWLYPKGTFTAEEKADSSFSNLLLVNSFHSAVDTKTAREAPDLFSVFSACDGTEKIASLLSAELKSMETGAIVYIFLSSESSNAAVDAQILSALRAAAENRKLRVHMLVQSANNSGMASRLIGAYMPMLVQGQLTLSVIQGTPQTFTVTMNIILREHAAILVTEAVHHRSTAVGTIIRDKSILRDMLDSFENSARFARPMMTAYNDSFARSIIEIFFEEYGVPGSLDVIKSGMNPMYMTMEQYGKVLHKFGHPEDQYIWRYSEFSRFKTAMDEVLCTSRFREIVSLTKLREIAETGRCRMPSMYFMHAGIWYLDAEDCADILQGYIHYLKMVPDFHVILLEDERLFMPNSCWHIKNNKHVMIHSWNIDEPMMVYSDQLMLIDEFQHHFDHLWEQAGGSGSKHRIMETLTALRDQCAGHIQK